MNVLVYMDGVERPFQERLLGIVGPLAERGGMEVISHIDGLRKRLCRLPREIGVAVLLAPTGERLEELTKLRDFFSGIPVVLILEDQEKTTVARGAKLFPSFIGSMDDDLGIVGDVLERMLRRAAAGIPG